MARTIPLTKMAQGTVGSDGTGRVDLGPTTHGVVWQITSMSVQSSSLDDSQCRIYKNGGGALVAGTYSGSMDTANGNVILQAQETLNAVWTDATVGATVQLTLLGTETIQGG